MVSEVGALAYLSSGYLQMQIFYMRWPKIYETPFVWEALRNVKSQDSLAVDMIAHHEIKLESKPLELH